MGQHGGGTFLLVYIPCLFLVAFPLMMSELMIGRQGRSNPVHAIINVARLHKLKIAWQIIGWLGIITSFLIFSYYSVVASWILFYILKSASGSFVDVPAEIVQHSYGALLHNSDQMLIWHGVFVLMVVMVLARGIRRGLEWALRLLMPCFIALIVWLCVFASQVGDFEQALDFVFSVDLSLINRSLIVSALTQALFTLSVCGGVLIIYGSYLGNDRSLFSGSAVILLSNTAIALIMGLMIFSIVFAFDMQADSGPGLIFQTLPVAFSQMPNDSILWSTLFFSLLLVAALTSGFALLEPAIVWMIDQFSISRRAAAWVVGILAWGVGWLSVYSFSDYQFSFYHFGELYQNGFFDLFNLLTTHFLMPLTALLVAIFAAWLMNNEAVRESFAIRFHVFFRLWRFCTRFIAPVIISVVLLLVALSRL